MKNPSPSQIVELRETAKITQKAMAEMIHSNTRSLQKWEAGDRKMHPAFWELLTIKVGRLIKT